MIEYENLRAVNAGFEAEFQKRFEEFLKSGWYILGSNVEAFEKEFAAYLGAQHFCGVASGLDALELALDALALPAGAEVIVPSNTYIATVLAVLNAGLKPVLVEPRLDTYNIDPSLLVQSITQKTGAVMIVHLYGNPCDMDAISTICSRHGLPLIEDCAQAHGAEYNGRKVGTFGIGAFSFYPTKNLGALGDGGGVCASADVDAKIRSLRNYGSSRKYYNDHIGRNSRLDEIQAALLRVKLPALDRINTHKARLASIYRQLLKQDFVLPVVTEKAKHVYHIFNVRHERRDDLREYLLKNEIKTEIHYPVAPHRQKGYAHLFSGSFPVSEIIHATTLSLPLSLCHSEADVERVAAVMNRF